MVAVAIGGAAVVGAGASVYAGSKAAKAQKKAAKLAAQTSQNQADQNRADLAPYRMTGYGALSKLAALSGVQQYDAEGKPVGTGAYDDGGFTASPGYQFRRDEGLKAVDRANAARGLLNSGGADKARMRYADGLASSEFDAYTSRLAQLAGMGQGATNTTVSSGTTAAGQIGAAQTAAGNATAAGYANLGSSFNSGVNNLASAYLYSQSPIFKSPAGAPSTTSSGYNYGSLAGMS